VYSRTGRASDFAKSRRVPSIETRRSTKARRFAKLSFLCHKEGMKKLFQWLKKGVIPHEENEYKPHFLRIHAFLAILSFVVAAEIGFLAWTFYIFPKTDSMSAILEAVLIDGTNVNRAERGLSNLTKNNLLEKAAQMKAEDMAAKNYFAHYGPDGSAPWDWIEKTGYQFNYAGENLAINFYDSEDVVQAWMNSEKHKENILNNNFTEVGIGISQGKYNGSDVIFVVQMFASPSDLPAKALATAGALPKAGEKKPTSGVGSSENSSTTKSVLSANKVNEGYPISFTKGAISPIEATGGTASTTTAPATVVTQQEGSLLSLNSSSHASFFQKIVSAPGLAIKMVYTTIFSIVLLLLTLNIFIKIKIQHPALIVNGVLLLAIIASAVTLNHYLLIAGAKIV